MKYINFEDCPYAFNCGVLEVGNFEQRIDDTDFHSGVAIATEFAREIVDLDWYTAVFDMIHRPIIVFSFNDEQWVRATKQTNTASFYKFLKKQRETVSLTKWVKNMDSKIKIATWIPSERIKKKIRKLEAQVQ